MEIFKFISIKLRTLFSAFENLLGIVYVPFPLNLILIHCLFWVVVDYIGQRWTIVFIYF